jgi:hypothetical protein
MDRPKRRFRNGKAFDVERGKNQDSEKKKEAHEQAAPPQGKGGKGQGGRTLGTC